MAFLIKEDFKTHIYAELIESITRADDSIIGKAITAGTDEVKAYLSRYDLLKLFGNNSVDPEVESEHLKNITKDVASWHLIKLANPNIDMKLFRTIYEDAIKFLVLVQKGQVDPDGWPYKVDDLDTTINENNNVQWNSNPKRKQHF